MTRLRDIEASLRVEMLPGGIPVLVTALDIQKAIRVAVEALRKIEATDYRGHPSTEQEIARKALDTEV